MLRSMTGFGSARRDAAGIAASAEIRSVNGRHLKVAVKGPPSLRKHEARLEALVRERLQRGSVTVSLALKHTDPARIVAIDDAVVAAYQANFKRLGLSEVSIPTLPGVIGSSEIDELGEEEAAAVEGAVAEALDQLIEMRQREGIALAEMFTGMCERIEELRAAVRELAPDVLQEAHKKLTDRLAQLMDGGESNVDPQLVAREVAILADRSDVTEELDRLGAHLEQLRELVAAEGSAGRKLEFLGQELLRESNTIGSKSADPRISRLVIELKALVEQLKEQAANVE